jgi:hypothetical protein
MTDWIYTLKPMLIGREWSFHVGDWITVSRDRAVRLHDDHVALAVCRLKSALRELDTAAPDRTADIIGFMRRFLWGMPVEARDLYGAWGIKDYMNYVTQKDILIGSKVYPAGSPLSDSEVQSRLKRLLESGALREVETQEAPPPVKEVQVVAKKKRAARCE